jgi:hypothetical protein
MSKKTTDGKIYSKVILKIINPNLMVGTETFPDGTSREVRYERIDKVKKPPINIMSLFKHSKKQK